MEWKKRRGISEEEKVRMSRRSSGDEMGGVGREGGKRNRIKQPMLSRICSRLKKLRKEQKNWAPSFHKESLNNSVMALEALVQLAGRHA